ncbi:hypothetical protein ANN_27355 [Periplaneta americana]|uniref:Uncharacterized protein n=1 Tax=Periplaneta americana TaxID=6978 RepID=A0ABQ8RXY4_PERAM|nr:hypothetical protein ANN_27355 [Periplaneta americana]
MEELFTAMCAIKRGLVMGIRSVSVVMQLATAFGSKFSDSVVVIDLVIIIFLASPTSHRRSSAGPVFVRARVRFPLGLINWLGFFRGFSYRNANASVVVEVIMPILSLRSQCWFCSLRRRIFLNKFRPVSRTASERYKGDNSSEMSAESYQAFGFNELRKNPGKTLTRNVLLCRNFEASVVAHRLWRLPADPGFLNIECLFFTVYKCELKTNAFVSLFANISNCTGLDVKKQKITNHSSRYTALSNIIRIGIQEQELIKITGQCYASSLKLYLRINEEYHSEILNNLSNIPCTSTSSLLLHEIVQYFLFSTEPNRCGVVKIAMTLLGYEHCVVSQKRTPGKWKNI